MTHTEYIELTELLRKLTGDADILREGRVYVSVGEHGEIQMMTRGECDQTKYSQPIKEELLTRTQNNVARAVEIMTKCVDGWVAFNQDRADSKRTVTNQDRALYEGMSGFMSATDKPIKNVSGVYASLRSRCRSWMDQATEWFPDLNAGGMASAIGKVMTEHQREVQEFKEGLFASPQYDEAVKKEWITPPNTWNGTKRELVEWLQLPGVLPYSTDRQDNRHPRWSLADKVFSWRGKLISGKDLSDTYQHIPKDY